MSGLALVPDILASHYLFFHVLTPGIRMLTGENQETGAVTLGGCFSFGLA